VTRAPRAASLPLAALLVAVVPASLVAQTPAPSAPAAPSGPIDALPSPPGWLLSPQIGVAQLWDDNPTLASEGNPRTADWVTGVRPSLTIGYRGRRTTLRADYAGTFDFYRTLSQQDRHDHRGGIDFTQRLTRRVQIFARNQAMVLPTTADAVEAGLTTLSRRTTTMNAFTSGVDAVLGRRTTLGFGYASQYVAFEEGDGELAPLLRGGHSHAGQGSLRHRVSSRVTVGADYELQRALITGGEVFDVQSALAIAEVALSPHVALSAGYGHAFLTAGRGGDSRSGPAFEVSLDWQARRVTGTLGYERSFVPSFGFGGTFQNESVRAELRATLARWLQWSSRLSSSNSDPLALGDPTLRAVSGHTALSVVVKRRLRIEGYGEHVRQDSSGAGGRVHRTRVGVQMAVNGLVRVR
jgi:hypothetical protein